MATAKESQEFHFVAYSGATGGEKKQSLTSIRKHVMHDYFRKQGKTTVKNEANTKRTRSKAKDETSKQSDFGKRATETHETLIPDLEDSFDIIDDPVASSSISISTRPSTKRPENPQSTLSVYSSSSPAAHRSDPFDTLPVKNIPDDLVEWFPCLYEGDMKNASWIHKSNVLWAQNIWHSSAQDKGLFYTVLSQAERNRMVVTRSVDTRRYLYLRGQALQALRKRIASTTNDDPNSLILLVAYQIRFAIVEGDLATARTHLQAASLLIKEQGDRIGPFVLVHASLMDVKLAAASGTRPVLEFKDPHLRLQTSAKLAEVVMDRTQASLAHFPDEFRGDAAREAMTGLHWHFLKFDANYGKEVDGSFSVLLNCVRTARHLRGLAADASEEDFRGKGLNPRIAIIFCIEFFAWMHDPAHIIPWISHSEYMKRLGYNVRAKLEDCLDLGNTRLEAAWEETGASRKSLLWVLMIGFVMTANMEAEANGYVDSSLPFLQTMGRVMFGLRIYDQAGLEQALKIFPWTDNFCGTWSKSIVARLGLPVKVQSPKLAEKKWPESTDAKISSHRTAVELTSSAGAFGRRR